MKRLVSGIVAVALAACSADPGYEPRYEPQESPQHVSSEPQPQSRTRAIAPPQKLVLPLQACVDKFALRLPKTADHYAVQYDLNVDANGITAKIKDSMIPGTDLESCLTNALENMEITASMVSTLNVSPKSRSAVGVVQAAAAPIALLPIVLVAGGVTILVAVTIFVVAEAVKRPPLADEESDDECTNGFVRCQENPAGVRRGNHWNITICGSCLEVCKQVKSWPVSIPLGNKFVPCY